MARAAATKRPPNEAVLATAPLDPVTEVAEEPEPEVGDAVFAAVVVARVALVPRTELLPPEPEPELEVATAKPEDTVPDADPEVEDPEDPLAVDVVLEDLLQVRS